MSFTTRLGVSACVVIACLIQAPASGVSRSEDPPKPLEQTEQTGGDVLGDPYVETEQARAKERLADEAIAVANGKGSLDRLKALESDYVRLYGPSALDASRATARGPSMALNGSTYRVLPVKHYPQPNTFYCGPATAYMMLKFMGLGNSAWTAYPYSLTQNNLASTHYLKTNQHGATRFALNVMASALNRWKYGTATGFYIQHSAIDTIPGWLSARFEYSVVGYGMPIALGAVEWYGQHYNEHPPPVSSPRGHWLVGDGYRDIEYERVYMTDPAADSPALNWPDAQPKFSYSSYGFWQYFLEPHGNGVVW